MEAWMTRFYLDNHEAWRAMLDLCANAKETIDMEQYIFSDDEIGRKFVEILRERARAGVKIRLLCDAVGSWTFYTSLLPAAMRKDGMEIRFYNVISPWRIDNFFSWFFRDHRKILIIDRKIGLTGSTGIRDDMQNWRDSNVEARGKIVHEMLFAFNEMWDRAVDRDLISRMKKSRGLARGFQFITNAPFFRKRFLYRTVIDAIRSANKYVFITTPYFVPDHRLVKALRSAGRRGVDVRIILPSSTALPGAGDSQRAIQIAEPIANLASRSHYEILFRAGVRIFEYKKDFLHAKTMVIDDQWSTIGSFNLDNLSFTYNYEANIVSAEEDFAALLKHHFLEDQSDSQEILLEDWLNRPLLEKFKELLVLPVRRFL